MRGPLALLTAALLCLSLAAPVSAGPPAGGIDRMPMVSAPSAGEDLGARLWDIDGTRLTYLSVSASNPYFSGNTVIFGTLMVTGAPGDRLVDMQLLIEQNGTRVASVPLTRGAQRAVLVPFDAHGRILIREARELFRISNAIAGGIDVTEDGSVSVRVWTKRALGGESYSASGSVALLTRYTGTNRYGGRDGRWCLDRNGHPTNVKCGGDDWVQPSILDVLSHFSGIRWGDMSNMNGGPFTGHDGHRSGTEADGSYAGYNERDAAAARKMIAYLDDPDYGSRIRQVFVTFDVTKDDPFWGVIKNAQLADGRWARDVITSSSDHTSHFHWVISLG